MKNVWVVLLILLFAGCAGNEPARVITKPKVDVNSPEFKAMITYLFKVRSGQRWGTKEYQADVEYYKGEKECP